MLRRIYEIRQFSPVLDRHWTNILIVGFLQVRVRVQSHPIDNEHLPLSARNLLVSRRGVHWFPLSTLPHTASIGPRGWSENSQRYQRRWLQRYPRRIALSA